MKSCIQKAREAAGLSRYQLSKVSGVPEGSIRHIELHPEKIGAMRFGYVMDLVWALWPRVEIADLRPPRDARRARLAWWRRLALVTRKSA